MRVTNLRRHAGEGVVRVSADVVWEDARRPAQEIWFEVTEEGSSRFAPAGEAFLPLCLPPALRRGEHRIRIEGIVCPRLRDGAAAAALLLRSWYGGERGEIAIEAEDGFCSPPREEPGVAFSFLTGGVDSTFTLLANHRAFEEGHPERIREALLVSELFASEARSPALAAEFDGRVRRAAGAIAAASGIPLTVLRTNARELEPSFDFFARESHSSILACAAHLLGPRLCSARIAAATTIRTLVPSGTHPVLDPLWSSSRVEILHDHFGLTRSEKTAEIVASPERLENLMVCQAGPVPDGFLNCGECEKCLRTLLSMAEADGLPRATSFRRRDLSPGRIFRGGLDPEVALQWRVLREELRGRHRGAFSATIGLKLLRSRIDPPRRAKSPDAYRSRTPRS
jgi:hypothetical protein